MAHLVVDGNNVIGSRPDGWWKDRAGATRRLHRRIAALVATGDEQLTLVLDGRPSRDLPEGLHDNVAVLYARRGGRNAADDRIVDVVRDAEDPAALTVVTSDRELIERVRTLGAQTMGAAAFLARLDELG